VKYSFSFVNIFNEILIKKLCNFLFCHHKLEKTNLLCLINIIFVWFIAGCWLKLTFLKSDQTLFINLLVFVYFWCFNKSLWHKNYSECVWMHFLCTFWKNYPASRRSWLFCNLLKKSYHATWLDPSVVVFLHLKPSFHLFATLRISIKQKKDQESIFLLLLLFGSIFIKIQKFVLSWQT